MSYTSRSNPNQSTKQPTLNEVLSDVAPPPYTISAFMTYLYENHCLETLQFTLEAKKYCETYNSLVNQADEPTVTTDSPACRHLCMLYQRLLTTYVIPGAPREVNLPYNVRSSLLQYKDLSTPPLPEALEPGVKNIHELMENSIFHLFLNSHAAPAHKEMVPESSNLTDIRSDFSVTMSDNESTQPVRLNSKHPFISPNRRSWSWPPWGRRPD